jgi:hypothetical protein
MIPLLFLYVRVTPNLFQELGFFMLAGEALGSFEEKYVSPFLSNFTTIVDTKSMGEGPHLCLKETLFLNSPHTYGPTVNGKALLQGP